MNLPAYQVSERESQEKNVNAGNKHPYRCECGQVLFKAYRKPAGLQIKCPRCKRLVEY